MRIIVWGINYAPETTGIGPHNTALCEFLKARGHDVEMVTTFSYYPAWSKSPEDLGCLYRVDQINGVPVHRCWHYVPLRVANWKRILHELSFAVTSTLRFLALPRPDLVIVVSPPLLLGAAAWLGGVVKHTRFIFHAQDLQPGGALELGMLKPGLFVRALLKLESFIYRKAHRVSGISRGMLGVFSKKGVPASKQIYFPNTIALPAPEEIPAAGRFRAKHGLSPDDFLAMHSGNVGVKHGLQVVVEAARLVANSRVKFIICGEGSARDSISELIARDGAKNILLLPLQPESDYREMLADIDVALITQQKGAGRSFFPSKLLNALAFNKPVLAVADDDTELSKAVAEGSFGVRVSPGESQTLALELDRLAGMPQELAVFGNAGRKFVKQFERERVFAEFAAAILA